MGALSEFFLHLYTMTTIFIFESLLLIQSALWRVRKPPISTIRYLELIEEKNPTICYRSELMPELINCAVCLSKFEEGEEIRELKCKHIFHKDCLDRWLQHDSATCPLCRSLVLPEIVNAHNEQDYDGSDDELIFLLSALLVTNLYRLFL
ncbi:hypothetical protein HHK36_009422 [Tetracentron sinense]|uniref:RING-type domain-containing protein n=1 Tax=Tetracentron sinense TaxID=13715 RepID=A0A834ZF75_TETSI|nr:hypothetical protein HHK36_009422 [Tetracentron sinense]